MMNRSPRLAVSIGCLIALLTGCGKKKEDAAEAEAPTPVMVETATLGAIDRIVTADAVLYPINQANVTPKISAPVKRILVNRGDHVRAGQLLAELESSDLASAVEESRHQAEQTQAALDTLTGATVIEDRTKAESDVKAAQAAVDAAKKLYDNRSALQREGALAQKLVDDANLQLVQAQSQLATAQNHLQVLIGAGQRDTIRGAQAQVNAAKAHTESAAVQLSYSRVTSPISGVISDRSVYPGEIAAAGSPLVSIVDISQVVARANVPVKDAAFITVGRPARITGPEGDLAGKVTVVSPAVDVNSTTVEVWVQTANPGEKLRPGGTVRVAIIAETIQNTLIVPAAALLNSDEGGQKIMVIGPDMVAQERKVSVGVRQGERVQIVSGVQAGEQVVVVGGLGLEDKAKVVIEAAKSEDDDDEAGDEAAPADAKGKGADTKGKDKK
jgi:multidrug efflux pump subunit AcrA (membrane-fusion protein)